MLEFTNSTIAAIGGLAGGIVLGITARLGRFCTLGAIEDALFGNDTTRLRIWGLAISVAIAGSFTLDYFGVISLDNSIYLANPVSIVATLAGSLLFGFGMALVGTCGYGTLARIGGGDLKSVVTFLVLGITAYATMRGAASYLRSALFTADSHSLVSISVAHHLARLTTLSPHLIAYITALLIAMFCLYRPQQPVDRRSVFIATTVGAVIVSGWFVTGYLAADPFTPLRLESYTFSAPPGETIIYVMTMTGSSLSFGIGATAGVITGAALTCLWRGEFYWEACDDARELKRQITGGVLMGFGGVVALGCTVGQGISAASTLALSAPIALLGIFAGAWAGLTLLIEGDLRTAFKNRFLR